MIFVKKIHRRIIRPKILNRKFFRITSVSVIRTQRMCCLWRNIHCWQKFYTAAGSDGMDKYHVCPRHQRGKSQPGETLLAEQTNTGSVRCQHGKAYHCNETPACQVSRAEILCRSARAQRSRIIEAVNICPQVCNKLPRQIQRLPYSAQISTLYKEFRNLDSFLKLFIHSGDQYANQ